MKKILLFMVDFYEYKKQIIEELSKIYEVSSYSDSVKLNSFERVLSKLNRKYKNKKFNKYFCNVLNTNKHQNFDKILIIFGGNFMNGTHISKLKECFPKTEIIYYAWDSVDNFPNIEELLKQSDKSYTFDPNDSKKYDVNFLPLYFSNKDSLSQKSLDVSTIMSFFGEKADTVNKVLSLFPNDLNKFIHLKIRDKFYRFQLSVIYGKKIKHIKKYFSYESISYHEVIEIMKKSKIVVDCPLPNQTGLTKRTFEALAMECKIITTNKDIKNYDFYSEDNIFIISEETNSIPNSFFNSNFNEAYKISDDYCIQSFVRKLLS